MAPESSQQRIALATAEWGESTDDVADALMIRAPGSGSRPLPPSDGSYGTRQSSTELEYEENIPNLWHQASAAPVLKDRMPRATQFSPTGTAAQVLGDFNSQNNALAPEINTSMIKYGTTGGGEAGVEVVDFPTVVLVQGFDHDPPEGNASFVRMMFHSNSTLASEWHSAALNFHYAQKHGYAHILYMYGNKGAACPHERFGNIHQPHWCKVLALLSAMNAFPKSDLFLWLDNDVVVRNMTVSIADFLKDALISSSDRSDSNPCGLPPLNEAFILAAWANTHWGCGPETGSLIIKRGATAHKLLRDWWDMANQSGPGPYDQGPFVDPLYERNKDKIAVIGEDSFKDNPAQFLLHRCSGCNWLPSRDDLMDHIGKENGIEGIEGIFKRMLSKSVSFKIRNSI